MSVIDIVQTVFILVIGILAYANFQMHKINFETWKAHMEEDHATELPSDLK